MNVHPFIIEYFFYGICLGAVLHITTWYWSKGLHWVVDALTGDCKK